jgi:hypothetical protein
MDDPTLDNHSFKQLRNHAQAFLKQIEKTMYILREKRDPESGCGFHPDYNILASKGQTLLYYIDK